MSTSSSLSIKDGVRTTSSLTGAPAAARPIAAIWPSGRAQRPLGTYEPLVRRYADRFVGRPGFEDGTHLTPA
jgi:hypothetical protein